MDIDIAPAPLAAPALSTTHLTPSRKRNHEGEVVNYTSPNFSNQLQSSPHTANQSPFASQGHSDHSTPLTDLGATPSVSPDKETDMAPKPKLTFAEKQIQLAIKQSEREEKERLKAEAKAKKEEEKAKKDEEKKRKEEEREAARKAKDDKKREKDAEKQAREAEKERKEAEALKRERAQMRIGNFFGKPAVSSTPPAVSDCGDVSRGTTPSRRSSITSIDMEPPVVDIKPSPMKLKPDEKPFIMPFFRKEFMELAPTNRFLSNRVFEADDLLLNQNGTPEKINVRFRRRRRFCHIKPVKKILSEMNGSESAPIDLTNPAGPLDNIPYKYLFYREDVRPAYQGTYTRAVSPRKVRKLAIKPTYRGLPDTDYDYDSEAEWAEPEEGDEEILDDDEKSEEGDGDEEMEDFLDDEGDMVKRQLVVGDMEPKCSGLCWENGDPPQNGFDMSLYRMDVLHDSTTFPINPFLTNHWSDLGKKSPAKREEKSQQVAMQPPRLPLMAVDPNGSSLTPLWTSQNHVPNQPENNNPTSKPKGNASKKPVQLVSTDVLPAFRAAVSGSRLTKVGLREVLKTQFPACTREAIKQTLDIIAERRGPKESAIWVLLDNSG
ncbi:hypothetical protein H2200_000826 [Cladophialophora chaetospira]|uniref:Chromatin assembly factor 1 subunit A n=1 Tax=Cladophialophora chaetospira TaxID=386627 RepID=A0AA38XP66_9EURO|nr:hypothetical protein H2200_000826 [Cladophialophora chaetospira]